MDYSKMWGNIEEQIKDQQLRLNAYREYDSPDYHRNAFIDTGCNNAKVHSYRGMQSLLEELQRSYPADISIFSAGKSEGYGLPDNALDIYGIHLYATEKPKRTALFVSGHHPHEWSGSETVYELARRMLESYHAKNQNIRELRKDTHVVLIPQVDVDQYDNLEATQDLEQYFKNGYLRLIEENPYLFDELCDVDVNYYGSAEGHEAALGFPPFRQSIAVKEAILDFIGCYGSPFLAIDYHEGSHGYLAMGVKNRGPPLWVLAEVSKSYPIASEDQIRGSIQAAEEMALDPSFPGFSDIMAASGAASFYTETPWPLTGDQSKESRESDRYTLAQRIEMNLIATDRILARYFLGI